MCFHGDHSARPSAWSPVADISTAPSKEKLSFAPCFPPCTRLIHLKGGPIKVEAHARFGWVYQNRTLLPHIGDLSWFSCSRDFVSLFGLALFVCLGLMPLIITSISTRVRTRARGLRPGRLGSMPRVIPTQRAMPRTRCRRAIACSSRGAFIIAAGFPFPRPAAPPSRSFTRVTLGTWARRSLTVRSRSAGRGSDAFRPPIVVGTQIGKTFTPRWSTTPRSPSRPLPSACFTTTGRWRRPSSPPRPRRCIRARPITTPCPPRREHLPRAHPARPQPVYVKRLSERYKGPCLADAELARPFLC